MTTTPDTSSENVARMLDGVTPGPWFAEGPDVCAFANGIAWHVVDAKRYETARFIAYAREALPAIAARVAELEAEVQAMLREERNKALREATSVAKHYRDMCGECNWPEDAVIVGGNVANDIANDIRALIQEAPHDAAHLAIEERGE